MNDTLAQQLKILGLKLLSQKWDQYLNEATREKSSYLRFLTTIISNEYDYKLENRRRTRLKDAKIPHMLVMQTFPFLRQPRLKKKIVMQAYDSIDYINNNQAMIFIGPTGCGKTGLATAYLIHAINNGFRGLFIDFREMLPMLGQAMADNSQHKIIKRLAAIDCLLIDEMGYMPLQDQQAASVFELIKQRHNKKCTIITTQLGFDEWNDFIKNSHLTAALIDRITENCIVFNMNKCISIRPKNVAYATEKKTDKPNAS